MAIGSAIAQGILGGVGKAGQQYFDDMRRQRLDDIKIKKSFDAFTKQADYSAAIQTKRDEAQAKYQVKAQKEMAVYTAGVQEEKEKSVYGYKTGMADIAAKGEQLTEWERVAKMNVQDIVYENALSASEKFAPSDRPAFIRDYLKRKSGVSKTVAINDRGLTLPDYSKYKNNPDYKDAIPVKRLAGVESMPDADSMFSFDESGGFMQAQKEAAVKLDKYDKAKRDAIGVIKDSALMTQQAEPSDAVAEYLWLKRPKEGDIQKSGSEVASNDETRLSAKIVSGDIVKINGMLKFKHELDDGERELLGLPPKTSGVPQAPQAVPQAAPTVAGAEYTDPTLAAQEEEKEVKELKAETDAKVLEMGKALGTGKGTPLTAHTELSEARDMINGMDSDALDYMFQVGFSTETVRDIAAKYGSESAQKAKDLISKMSSTVNAMRHQLFGSALTEGEAAAFKQQFADIGAFNNKENLLTQLDNLISKSEMGVAEKMAGYTPEQRAAFLERNPKYKAVMAQVELPEAPKASIMDAQGNDVSATLPEQFWSASPEKQQQFLTKYGFNMGGK